MVIHLKGIAGPGDFVRFQCAKHPFVQTLQIRGGVDHRSVGCPAASRAGDLQVDWRLAREDGREVGSHRFDAVKIDKMLSEGDVRVVRVVKPKSATSCGGIHGVEPLKSAPGGRWKEDRDVDRDRSHRPLSMEVP